MWVPLVENNEFDREGADFFVKEYLYQLMEAAPQTDTIVLACTHYPLLMKKIRQFLPAGTTVLSQGKIVAHSLRDYLHRHPEMESRLLRNAEYRFYTTDDAAIFERMATIFFGASVTAYKLELS